MAASAGCDGAEGPPAERVLPSTAAASVATAAPRRSPPRVRATAAETPDPNVPAAPEPRSDGRTAAEWLDALPTPDGRKDWRALHAIEALGRDALRQMVARFVALEDADPRVPAFAEAVGSTMCSDDAVLDDVLGLAVGEAPVARRRALDLLSRYAWHAYGREAAVGARLAPLLRVPDPATRVLVLRSLDRVDDGALSIAGEILALSGDPDAQVRAAVLEAHVSSAPGWSEMVVRAFADPDALVRAAACEDVRRTGPRQPRVVMERVAAALRDADERVRAGAANALAQSAWGFEGIVVPPLAEAVADETSGIALQATHALVKLERADVITLERLTQLLRAGETRWAAADALAQRGAAAAEAVPDLVAALGDPNSLNAGSAARALRVVSPGDERALAGIVGFLRRAHSEGYERCYALEALAPYGARAVPALCGVLTDNEESIRRKAADTLTDLGAEAVPGLLLALDERDASRRAAALSVLSRIQPSATAVRAAALLGDGEASVRRAAVEALAADRTEVARSVAPLTERIADADARVRTAAVRALGTLDPLPETARDALRRALRDRNPDVCVAAARALQPRTHASAGAETMEFDGTEPVLGE